MTAPSTWHLTHGLERVRCGSVHVYRDGPGKPFTRRQTHRMLRRMIHRHGNPRPLCIDGHAYHRRTRARRNNR